MIDDSPRSRRRERNRRRILDSALELVSRHGLEGLTMSRLADATDYTPGALYRYHPSKEALLVALQLDVLTRWAVELDRAATTAPRTGDTALDHLITILVVSHRYIEFSTADPTSFALATAVLGNPRKILDDETASPLISPFLRVVNTVGRSLDAASSGTLSQGPAQHRALVMITSLQGVLQTRKLERLLDGALEVDRVARELIRTLLVGWGADELLLTRAEASLSPPI